MSGPQPTLGLQEFRDGSHKLAQARRDARRDFERYAQQEAEAERDYRRTAAQAFARAKVEGSVAEAERKADAEAAEARYKRDIARSMAKAAELRIRELEADRASLRVVAEWSQRLDGLAA